MKKQEFAARLAKDCDVTQAKAAEIIDAIFDTAPGKGIIATELDAGRDMPIVGFGTFKTRATAARTGRNPQTGASIQIKAGRSVGFAAGKGLKDRVKK